MSTDWADAADNQEREENKKLMEKLGQMKLKKETSSEPSGWPKLDDEDRKPTTDEFKSNWNSDTSSGSRPPATGGAGRGRGGFKLTGSNQSTVGTFAALGTGNGNGNNHSFGQFGGGVFGATMQQAFGDQTNRNKSSPFGGGIFNTNSATEPKTTSSPGFGNFGSGGGEEGATKSKTNWPTLDQDENMIRGTAKSPSERWPNLSTDELDKNGTNTTTSTGGGGTSTVGRLADESWEEEEGEKPLDKVEASYLNKILHDRLVNTKYDVEIERQNPNNPLFSVKSFDELRLSQELLNGVYEMGFTYPSKIQESALPALLADPPQNMIAQSQSGTGKTAAFVLTMLSRVDPSQRYPQCLCLSPTYELALQIGKVVEKMGKFLTDVKVAYAVRGGKRVERGEKVTEQIIIGTPGTVFDWMLKFRCFDPKRLAVFVLDEADHMIGLQGLQDQSIRVHKQLSPNCQHLLFSATYDDQVMDFAYKIISDPVVIRLRREEETLDYIQQYFVECPTREDKYKALCNIYGTLTIGQAVIFCRTKKEASWLAGQMSRDGHLVGLLSSELEIDQRAAVIDRFKRGTEKVLISTNLTARGIDVEQVTIVINYDLPVTVDHEPDYDTYLHRIGRTGRFGKAGMAINFIDSKWSKGVMEKIEAHFGKRILPLDTEDVEALGGIEKNETW